MKVNKFFKDKEKLWIILFCVIVSVISLTICSKNSFLYPFNNWPDENAFFTVGRAWLHGKIPYRDIFEQKGPLLYFIFLIAAFFDSKSFIVIFIFEVISFSICLYYVAKIIEQYLDKKYNYLILPLFASILTSSPFFVHGGSAEEFCLPLLVITLYTFLKFLDEKEISRAKLVGNGIIAGCIAMIKYTLIGFWGAFMLCIFLYYITKKDFKKAFTSCLWFLLGMLLPIIIFFGYFYLVDSWKEFIKVYILFNKNNYSTQVSIFSRLKEAIHIFYRMINQKFVIFTLIDVGIIYFIFSKKMLKTIESKISILLFLFMGICTVYYGLKDFPYYFLIFLPFILFGMIGLFVQTGDIISSSKLRWAISIIIIYIASGYLLSTSNNLYYKNYQKKDLVQYKFANIIHQNKGTTLLNYGFLDGGFYIAANIIPSNKYFMSLNAVVPEMDQELTTKIEKREFDFIVIRSYELFDPTNELIKENYRLISSEKEILEGIEFTYDLYQKEEMEK